MMAACPFGRAPAKAHGDDFRAHNLSAPLAPGSGSPCPVGAAPGEPRLQSRHPRRCGRPPANSPAHARSDSGRGRAWDRFPRGRPAGHPRSAAGTHRATGQAGSCSRRHVSQGSHRCAPRPDTSHQRSGGKGHGHPTNGASGNRGTHPHSAGCREADGTASRRCRVDGRCRSRGCLHAYQDPTVTRDCPMGE